MKVLELLERRRKNWLELERLCDNLQSLRFGDKHRFPEMTRFAALYRAACADLALADAYQLPQNTVQYLHRLVGRARNQLYRSKSLDVSKWLKILFEDVPQQIFNDRCIQFMFVLFWAVFLGAAFLAANNKIWPDFAHDVLGTEHMEQLKQMYSSKIGESDRDANINVGMAGFYISHNTGIGFQCFAMGVLVIPGLFIAMKNALILGASFGYMAQPEILHNEGQNFFHFVTAHGPFELTAIVLSAGAGLRLGLSWIIPGNMSRLGSLQFHSRKLMPIIPAIMILFFLAALIEGFVSPSSLPYAVKVATAMVSSGMLLFYFVVLGMPRGARHAA